MLPTPGTAALLAGPYTPNTTAALASMQPTSFPVSQFTPVSRPSDPFGENQAANGLVFLAQTSQQQAQQPPQNASTREELVKRAATNNAKVNAYQDPATLMNKKTEETTKNTRSKKAKAEEPPSNSKESSSKKSKTKAQETDDDKRRNFLERNRQGTKHKYNTNIFFIAALKCRQRKKQWLSSLQQKVDWYTRENELLSSEVGQLREQVTGLKTLLAAHKDCPVAHQNGATPEAIAQAVGQSSVFPVHAYR
jgi:ATF/CREB family transcription factor